MTFEWPRDFPRIPDEPWTLEPVDDLALGYDAVKHHSWYANLNPTIENVIQSLKEGQLFLDYSGGTGIFEERLLPQIRDRRFGIVIVDSSPKFLRLSLEKFKRDDRIAFRVIQYLKNEKRLQTVEEVANLRFDGAISTNAIHLYYDLQDTLKSWIRVLRSGAKLFIQSGSVRNPAIKPGEWIIDETVHAIYEAAVNLVRSEDRFSAYRATLNDPQKMKGYEELRHKYFLPARPLSHYIAELEKAGFSDIETGTESIEANVNEWVEFLKVYADGILGWVGGVEKVEGNSPSPAALEDRLVLLKEAAEKVFSRKSTFKCCWSYLTCLAP